LDTNSISSHVEDDLLEHYAMNALAESKLAQVEEHLLLCSSCQDRLTETEDFLLAIRSAAASLEKEVAVAKPAPSVWQKLFAVPKPVWAAGFAVAAALFVAVPMMQDDGTVQPVTLIATRGAEKVGQIKPGLVDLKLNAAGLNQNNRYSIEIVTESGNPVHTGAGRWNQDRVEAVSPVKLAAGTYWVRLYDTANDREPLREYALVVGK
jgi:hypothetical protein